MSINLQNQEADIESDSHQINDSDLFTCNICCIEYDLKVDEVEIKMLSGCNHAFCADCFKETFRALIEDQMKSDKLSCPEYGCQIQPSKEEIVQITGENCFGKYQKFQKNRMVAQTKNLFFCPIANCETVLDSKQQKMKDKNIECHSCKNLVCSGCKQEAHKGLSCDQNEQNQMDSWARQGLNVHKCPQCQAPVEKAGGCQYMSCGNCNHYWCWICGMHCTDHDSKWSMHYFFAPFCGIFDEMSQQFQYQTTTKKIINGIIFVLLATLMAKYYFYIVYSFLVVIFFVSYISSGLVQIFEQWKPFRYRDSQTNGEIFLMFLYNFFVRFILATVVFLAVCRAIICIAWYITYAILAIMSLMLVVFVFFALTVIYRWALTKRVTLFPANDLQEKLIDDQNEHRENEDEGPQIKLNKIELHVVDQSNKV